MSGSSDTLLRHRPLRTVHASFPAYGSSLYKPVLAYEPATKICTSINEVASLRISTDYHSCKQTRRLHPLRR
ncbi:hypothetical protein C1E47_08110 [Vibrio cholerae]|nr:hypothetical protein [Vibrio cholerae]